VVAFSPKQKTWLKIFASCDRTNKLLPKSSSSVEEQRERERERERERGGVIAD
jgi:hypothetical protein